jgi:hypothetical protein
MQCRARFTTVESTTINSGLLISGLRAHTAVILAQNLALLFCWPYADIQGRFPAGTSVLHLKLCSCQLHVDVAEVREAEG